MSDSDSSFPRTESCTAECKNGRHGLGCPHDLEKIVGEGVPSAEQFADALEFIRANTFPVKSSGINSTTELMVAYADKVAALRETAARAELQKEIKELRGWKESAMSIMGQLDLQAIGQELDMPLGVEISSAVLPAIKKLKERETAARRASDVCPVCFTISWAPCSPETPNAVEEHGSWMVCQTCAAKGRETAAREQERERLVSDIAWSPYSTDSSSSGRCVVCKRHFERRELLLTEFHNMGCRVAAAIRAALKETP